ncbi:hypothetical protein L7F22_061183 [Adiantum nelumboides]|nr:hypothetical protein [Adiantum nelumboides]
MARQGLLPQFLQPWMHRRGGGAGGEHLQKQKQKPKPSSESGGKRRHMLGAMALLYVSLDYLRVVAPTLHSTLQPILWAGLALAAASRSPFYPHWSYELRALPAFLASLLFMLGSLCIEAIAVQFVTVVLGLSWHKGLRSAALHASTVDEGTLAELRQACGRKQGVQVRLRTSQAGVAGRLTAPLPDTGQWFLLALNEQLPSALVEVLRAHLVALHHYLMLFLMLAFSVLFDFVKAPGLGLGARYMFTMGIGRLLRVMTFVATVLPSARPWCAEERFKIPDYPHPWVQRLYTPYAKNVDSLRDLLDQDMAYAPVGQFPPEYTPNWGRMQFLVDFLRPQEPDVFSGQESWFTTLKRAGGGCNDLMYSGHVLVASLTAMAWTEAYPGWTTGLLWFFVLHTAQREIRERHHYSADVIGGIYMGILLWRSTSFLWTSKDRLQEARLQALAKVEGRIMQAAKDGDVINVRQLLKQVEDDNKEKKPSQFVVLIAASVLTTFSLGIALLAFVWTADG